MERKIDPEQLIATIKLHQPIWNKNSKDYHRKINKEVAWNRVCEELVEGWHELSEENKVYRQGDLKKRWNNIRDYYKKDLALQTNGTIGQPAMKRNKYIFSKQLAFLKPVLERPRPITYEKTASDDETEEIYLEDNCSSDSETSHLLQRKKAIKLLEDDNLEESKTSDIVASVATRSTDVDEDSDLLFFKSLLPDMKMMNFSQKIDFKMGVLKLYKEIMYENVVDEFECEDTKNPLK